MFAFADDMFILKMGTNVCIAVEDMEISLAAIIKWMKQSGLKINENKTEVCTFFKHELAQPIVRV